MTAPDTEQGAFSRRTAWVRSVPIPLREFLRTETGGAAVLLAATIAALLWVNVDSSSYADVWETRLQIQLGDGGVDLDLRHWVNSGLMTFFFFVIGQVVMYAFSSAICSATSHYLDGLFIATICNLLAVMMIYKVRCIASHTLRFIAPIAAYMAFHLLTCHPLRSTGTRSLRRISSSRSALV